MEDLPLFYKKVDEMDQDGENIACQKVRENLRMIEMFFENFRDPSEEEKCMPIWAVVDNLAKKVRVRGAYPIQKIYQNEIKHKISRKDREYLTSEEANEALENLDFVNYQIECDLPKPDEEWWKDSSWKEIERDYSKYHKKTELELAHDKFKRFLRNDFYIKKGDTAKADFSILSKGKIIFPTKGYGELWKELNRNLKLIYDLKKSAFPDLKDVLIHPAAWMYRKDSFSEFSTFDTFNMFFDLDLLTLNQLSKDELIKLSERFVSYVAKACNELFKEFNIEKHGWYISSGCSRPNFDETFQFKEYKGGIHVIFVNLITNKETMLLIRNYVLDLIKIDAIEGEFLGIKTTKPIEKIIDEDVYKDRAHLRFNYCAKAKVISQIYAAIFLQKMSKYWTNFSEELVRSFYMFHEQGYEIIYHNCPPEFGNPFEQTWLFTICPWRREQAEPHTAKFCIVPIVKRKYRARLEMSIVDKEKINSREQTEEERKADEDLDENVQEQVQSFLKTKLTIASKKIAYSNTGNARRSYLFKSEKAIIDPMCGTLHDTPEFPVSLYDSGKLFVKCKAKRGVRKGVSKELQPIVPEVLYSLQSKQNTGLKDKTFLENTFQEIMNSFPGFNLKMLDVHDEKHLKDIDPAICGNSERHSLIVLYGAPGSGKSSSIKNFINNARIRATMKNRQYPTILALCDTASLGQAMSEEWDLAYYDDPEYKKSKYLNELEIVVTMESLHRTPLGDPYEIFIQDEINNLLEKFNSSTIYSKNPNATWDKYMNMMKYLSTMIISDADSDLALPMILSWLKTIKDVPVDVYIQACANKQTDDFKYSFTEYKRAKEIIQERIRKKIPTAIVCDKYAECVAIKNLMLKHGIRKEDIALFHGSKYDDDGNTKRDPKVKELLRNSKTALKDKLFFIANSAIISGISIENHPWRTVIGLCSNAILTPRKWMQLCHRVRAIPGETIEIICGYQHSGSPNESHIAKFEDILHLTKNKCLQMSRVPALKEILVDRTSCGKTVQPLFMELQFDPLIRHIITIHCQNDKLKQWWKPEFKKLLTHHGYPHSDLVEPDIHEIIVEDSEGSPSDSSHEVEFTCSVLIDYSMEESLAHEADESVEGKRKAPPTKSKQRIVKPIWFVPPVEELTIDDMKVNSTEIYTDGIIQAKEISDGIAAELYQDDLSGKITTSNMFELKKHNIEKNIGEYLNDLKTEAVREIIKEYPKFIQHKKSQSPENADNEELKKNQTITHNTARSVQNPLCNKLVQHLGFKDLDDVDTKLHSDIVQQKIMSFYQELLDDEQERENWNSLNPLKKPTITIEKLKKAMITRTKNTIVKNLLQSYSNTYLEYDKSRGHKYYLRNPETRIEEARKKRKTDNFANF